MPVLMQLRMQYAWRAYIQIEPRFSPLTGPTMATRVPPLTRLVIHAVCPMNLRKDMCIFGGRISTALHFGQQMKQKNVNEHLNT